MQARTIRIATLAAAALGVGVVAFGLTPTAEAWGWRYSPPENAAELAERMRSGAHRVLSMADANEAQERAVYAALDEAAPELWARRTKARALRGDLVTALGRPKVDKAELQRIRGAALAQLEEASNAGVDLVVELANILSPEQRAELLKMWERWHR